MLTSDPTFFKLLETSRPISVGKFNVFPIPENVFTKQEIEILREEDKLRRELYDRPLIANFLPDDIRPKGIPKL